MENTESGEQMGTMWKPEPARPASLPPERISVETARHILRLLEGDWATEEKIVKFLREKYGAPTVLDIPPKIAREIIRRPGDFIRAAKAWAEPELF